MGAVRLLQIVNFGINPLQYALSVEIVGALGYFYQAKLIILIVLQLLLTEAFKTDAACLL